MDVHEVFQPLAEPAKSTLAIENNVGIAARDLIYDVNATTLSNRIENAVRLPVNLSPEEVTMINNAVTPYTVLPEERPGLSITMHPMMFAQDFIVCKILSDISQNEIGRDMFEENSNKDKHLSCMLMDGREEQRVQKAILRNRDYNARMNNYLAGGACVHGAQHCTQHTETLVCNAVLFYLDAKTLFQVFHKKSLQQMYGAIPIPDAILLGYDAVDHINGVITRVDGKYTTMTFANDESLGYIHETDVWRMYANASVLDGADFGYNFNLVFERTKRVGCTYIIHISKVSRSVKLSTNAVASTRYAKIYNFVDAIPALSNILKRKGFFRSKAGNLKDIEAIFSKLNTFIVDRELLCKVETFLFNRRDSEIDRQHAGGMIASLMHQIRIGYFRLQRGLTITSANFTDLVIVLLIRAFVQRQKATKTLSFAASHFVRTTDYFGWFRTLVERVFPSDNYARNTESKRIESFAKAVMNDTLENEYLRRLIFSADENLTKARIETASEKERVSFVVPDERTMTFDPDEDGYCYHLCAAKIGFTTKLPINPTQTQVEDDIEANFLPRDQFELKNGHCTAWYSNYSICEHDNPMTRYGRLSPSKKVRLPIWDRHYARGNTHNNYVKTSTILSKAKGTFTNLCAMPFNDQLFWLERSTSDVHWCTALDYGRRVIPPLPKNHTVLFRQNLLCGTCTANLDTHLFADVGFDTAPENLAYNQLIVLQNLRNTIAYRKKYVAVKLQNFKFTLEDGNALELLLELNAFWTVVKPEQTASNECYAINIGDDEALTFASLPPEEEEDDDEDGYCFDDSLFSSHRLISLEKPYLGPYDGRCDFMENYRIIYPYISDGCVDTTEKGAEIGRLYHTYPTAPPLELLVSNQAQEQTVCHIQQTRLFFTSKAEVTVRLVSGAVVDSPTVHYAREGMAGNAYDEVYRTTTNKTVVCDEINTYRALCRLFSMGVVDRDELPYFEEAKIGKLLFRQTKKYANRLCWFSANQYDRIYYDAARWFQDIQENEGDDAKTNIYFVYTSNIKRSTARARKWVSRPTSPPSSSDSDSDSESDAEEGDDVNTDQTEPNVVPTAPPADQVDAASEDQAPGPDYTGQQEQETTQEENTQAAEDTNIVYAAPTWYNLYKNRTFNVDRELKRGEDEIATIDENASFKVKVDGDSYFNVITYIGTALGVKTSTHCGYVRALNDAPKEQVAALLDRAFRALDLTLVGNRNYFVYDSHIPFIFDCLSMYLTYQIDNNDDDIRNQPIAKEDEVVWAHDEGTCFNLSSFEDINKAKNWRDYYGLNVKIDQRIDPCFDKIPFHGRVLAVEDGTVVGPLDKLPDLTFEKRELNLKPLNKELPALARELRTEKDANFKELHSDIAEHINNAIPDLLDSFQVSILEGTYGSGKTYRMKKHIEKRFGKPKSHRKIGSYVVITPTKALAQEYREANHPAYSWSTVTSVICGAKRKYHLFIDEAYLFDSRVFALYATCALSITMIGDSRQMRSPMLPTKLDLTRLIAVTPSRFNIAFATPLDVVAYLNKDEPFKTLSRSRVVNSVVKHGVASGKTLPEVCTSGCSREHEHAYGATFDRAHAHKIGYPTVATIQGLRSPTFNLFISSSSKQLIQGSIGQKLVAISRHTRELHIYSSQPSQLRYIDVPVIECKCGSVGSRTKFKGIDGYSSVANYVIRPNILDRTIRTNEIYRKNRSGDIVRKDTKKVAGIELEPQAKETEAADTEFAVPLEYNINECRATFEIPQVHTITDRNDEPDDDEQRVDTSIAAFNSPYEAGMILAERLGNQSQVADPNSIVGIDSHREPKPTTTFVINTHEPITQEADRLRSTVQFARNFGTRQRDSPNHTIATAIERYGASKPDPTTLRNLDFSFKLLNGFRKFVEFDEMRPPTESELSLCKGEALLRAAAKQKQPELQAYGQDFGSTALIKCFNKRQIKSKVGADVWLNAKEQKDGDLYIKGGQPISAQPKEVNHVTAPWITWVERCLIKCSLPGVHLGYGYPPKTLANKIKRNFSRNRNKMPNSRFLSADVSEQDTSKHTGVNNFIRMIYKQCGVPDEVINMLEAPNKRWTANARVIKSSVKEQFQSGRSDTLLSNTMHSMGLIGMSFDFDDMIIALFQGDDSMVRASNFRATADFYHRLKIELNDTGEFVGFLVSEHGMCLDIPRIAAKLLSKSIDDKSRFNELRLAVVDLIKNVTNQTQASIQNLVNTAHYEAYGFTEGEIEILWAYLVNFSNGWSNAYLPNVKDSRNLVKKMNTVFTFRI